MPLPLSMARPGLIFQLLLLLLPLTCSDAKDNQQQHCPTSSCGNISNISFPFWLNTNPHNCTGLQGYNLSCENNNLTVLFLGSAKFYVQAIDYDNLRIRVVDSGIQKRSCSFIPAAFNPPRSTQFYSIFSDGIVFISCQHPVNGTDIYDASACVNASSFSTSPLPESKDGKRYYYVVMGEIKLLVLKSLCRIELISDARFSKEKNYSNLSYLDVPRQLEYGFELTWVEGYCGECSKNRSCIINRNNSCVYDGFDGFDAFKFWLRYWLIDRIGALLLGIYFWPQVWHQTIGFSLLSGHGIALLLSPLVLWLLARSVIGIPCFIILLAYKWRRRHLCMYDSIEEFLQNNNNLMPVRYSYSNIKKMTNGFKDKLGEGGFGEVYKAKLKSGRLAAIKLLGKSKAGKSKAIGQDFVNEVATIGRIHHVNVVKLIGFCVEGSKRALVYDFMSNGSLDKHIFPQEGNASLGWESLYKIALGVARGIEYLHQGCDMQILHFDIKPHNILLDENFIPKISDFGLAKLYSAGDSVVSLTAARGTLGYMAPELFYKNIGGVSYKADVYSYGMLLMEMASKRKNLNPHVEHSSQIFFPSWVSKQINKGIDLEISEIVDDQKKMVKKMIIVALWCIQMRPADRPSMHRVVEMLEAELESLQMPSTSFQFYSNEIQEDDSTKATNVTGFSSSSCNDTEIESICLLENEH